MPELYGGVETGGTWCVCVLGHGPGAIVADAQFPTAEPAPTLTRIVEFFRSRARPAAVGVGSFGPVDLDPGSPTWGCVTSTPKPGWQHVSVARVLQEALDVPIAFDTDVAAAGLAEHRWGAGRGVRSLCYVTVGTGIGTGLVIDGRPWHGLVHPEGGHMRVPHDRELDPFPGSCPMHGDCWEGLASGAAMAARWLTSPEELGEDHPGWALEADYLALGILNLTLVVSPQRVVLGGGLSEHAPLLGMVRERLPALAGGYLEAPELGPELDRYLVVAELGDRAGALGALALAENLRA